MQYLSVLLDWGKDWEIGWGILCKVLCWGRRSQCSNFYNHYVGHRGEEDQLHYAMGPICVEVFEILNFEYL